MAKHLWHDRSGPTVVVVEMTDEQAQADAQVVRAYEGLCALVTDGKDANGDAAADVRSQIYTRLLTLPRRRAVHWAQQLKNLGVDVPRSKLPAPEAAPTPEPAPQAAATHEAPAKK